MPHPEKTPLGKKSGFAWLSRLRRANAPLPPRPSPNDLLAELTVLAQKIAAHATRLQIGEIVTQARTLQNSLSQPTGAPEWQDFLRECLQAAVEATRLFATRHPHLTEPTDPAVMHFSRFLTALFQTLGNLHAKLTAEHPAGSTAGIDAYRSTLRQINQAYLGDGR